MRRLNSEVGSPGRGLRASFAVAALGGVMIGLFWVGLLYHLEQRRTSLLDTTRADMARLSIAVQQQVERLIGGLDSEMRSAQDLYAKSSSASDLAGWMRREVALGDLALQVVVADEHGRIVSAKRPGAIDLAGTELFASLAAQDGTGLHVDRTALDPATGRHAIRFARRLNRPDGSFGGLVAVSLDAEYLTGQFRTLAMGDDGCIALFGEDGYLRARSPTVEDGYAMTLPATPAGRVLLDRLAAAEGGSVDLACLSEQGACLFAFRRLSALPLFVVVGKATSEILRPYQGERSAILVVGASLSVIVLVLFAGLFREVERRRRRDVELDAVHGSLQSAHRALSEREAFLRGVLEGSADCINVLTPDGRLRFAGRPAPHLGMQPDTQSLPAAAVGEPFAALWPEAARARVSAAIRQAVAGERALVTIACRAAGGATRHLDLLVAPIGSACPPDHLIAITRDITHLRAAEAALRESEARYRLLADHATDMVVRCDPDGTLRYVSPSARDLLGHAPEALVGAGLRDILHPEEAGNLASVFERLTRSAIGQATGQHRARRSDGTETLLEARLRRISETDGQAAGLIVTLRDISEQHAAEEALARKTSLLELTLENMDQGILLIDADRTVPVSNRRAQELLQLPPELMATQPPYALVREHLRRAHRWGSLIEAPPNWILSEERRSIDVRIERRSADDHFMDVRTVPAGLSGGVVQTFTDITDQKRAEEAARAAEALFRGLFESSTDLLIVFRVDSDGRFAVETINASAARVLGQAVEAVRGWRVEALLPAPAAGRVRAEIERVIATGEVVRNEERGLSDEDRVWELIHVPLPHASGDRVERVCVSIRDITHLRSAEAAVREKTVLLEATLESMDQGLLMVDAAGQILVYNRRVVDLLDLPAALMGSRPSLGEVVAYLRRHGEYDGEPEGIRTGRDLCLNRTAPASYERTRPNGTVIEVRIAPLPGGGTVQTFTDITAVRASQVALRESEARYRLLADNASDLIVLGHADGRRSYISPAVTSMLGYTVEEAHGISMRAWIHPRDLEAVFAATRALTPLAPVGSVVYRLRRKDGRYIWAEAALRRAEGLAGDYTIVTAIRDVTERQERTEELSAARDSAELARVHADRASQAKSDFLAAMSHEIRTPLNAIIGFTGLMLDSAALSPDIRQHADNIAGSGQALLTIINDILDFSEVEAGTIRLDAKPFDAHLLIENCFSIVRGFAVNKRLEFRSVIDPDLPETVVGDEGRLRQILLNLLNNAVKFTKAGYVALGVRREASSAEGETIRFSVTDTGIGIPRDKQDRLFRNFSQVDGSIRREFGGTGLGLAITKRLVEMMDGRVGVFSEEGRGSTFWFTVTLPRAASAALPAKTCERPPPLARRGHLLLVEDVEVNRKLARIILEAAGHTVAMAEDGHAAIEAVRREAFDLVLMDVQMPGLDGMQATRAIRALGAPRGTIPIIAMTANVLPQQVRSFRAAGMDDHIGKPINREDLYATIERWLAPDTESVPVSAAGEVRDADPRIDETSFAQLLEIVGSDSAAEIVDSFRRELTQCFLGEPATPGARDQLRKQAHMLIPASCMLGFRALFEAISALEATTDDSAFPVVLQRARSERDHALDHTTRLLERINRTPQIAA